MPRSLKDLLALYDPTAPLDEASTIPASWYVDPALAAHERSTVFSRTWQWVARVDQLRESGQYVTADLAGEPIVVVRGDDGQLRGFFNVCRHHAAEVMTEPCGRAASLRCPYHGWTYGLDGALKGTPDFHAVRNFNRADHGLVPIEVASWERFVFARIEGGGPSLEQFLGDALTGPVRALGLDALHFLERRSYAFDCNWKVFVDNYLDGGYHIPHLHQGLDSVLDYAKYSIVNGERFCLQSSPLVHEGAEAQTGAVRRGERALYYWLYPNFMINWYEGVMDTNFARPLGVDKTEVVFDFYFADVSSEAARTQNLASIDVGQRIQDEDTAICRSVQRGLTSRAYQAGRLSVRREAGEHLFHRLLHADLSKEG